MSEASNVVKRRKVCVVVTARPSYSRVKSVLEAVRARKDVDLQLIVAASALLDRYGDAASVIEEDGFEVAQKVFMVLEGGGLPGMAKTAGLGLLELATAFDNLRPDVIVTVADRYETISTAVASAFLHIPLAHIQGGEVTGSIDEKVRHAITKLADIHFVATKRAAERVIRMGEDPKSVHLTGCPSIDLASEVLARPHLNFDPIEKYGGVGATTDFSSDYIVVMLHPVTNEHRDARWQVNEVLEAVAESGMPAFWFWPNVDAGSDGTSTGIRAFRERSGSHRIRFFKNMEPLDFLRLIVNARALLGNSSVGIRESALLGVPVVNVGTRQVGRERASNVLDVGYSRADVLAGIRKQTAQTRFPQSGLYGDGHSGARIADLLATCELGTEKRLHY